MSSDSEMAESRGQAPADKRTPEGRRGFLLGAGTAGAAGVAAVALGTRAAPNAGEGASAQIQKDASPVQGRGYRETAHIRKYYDTTKV